MQREGRWGVGEEGRGGIRKWGVGEGEGEMWGGSGRDSGRSKRVAIVTGASAALRLSCPWGRR